MQVAIGNRQALTSRPTDEEWELLYSECEKHALLGIALPREQFPPFDVAAEWVHDAQVAKERNQKVTKISEIVCRQLEKDGFWTCILKGQANLINYPEWLRDYRTSGDIDLWAWPLNIGGNRRGIKDVILYSIDNANKAGIGYPAVRYNNTELPGVWPIAVEIHHRPSFMNCWYRNRRLQKWCKDNVRDSVNVSVSGCTLPIATTSFNAVYQLSHIYCHLFDEGIGLRQILDYYFVLQTLSVPLHRGMCGDVRDERFEIMHVIEHFGMKKFASAMMYVLQTVFVMPDEYLICKPNEKEGKFLLSEIMQAGNFGKYDERIKRVEGSYLKVQCNHAFEKWKHNLRLIAHYPEEVLWEPIFRVYHFVWRKFEWWRV